MREKRLIIVECSESEEEDVSVNKAELKRRGVDDIGRNDVAVTISCDDAERNRKEE